MDENEATSKVNPIDDIQFVLEDSGCYNEEIEAMKTAGTYDAFIHKVYNAIDWSNLFERMTQMENETIANAIDEVRSALAERKDVE